MSEVAEEIKTNPTDTSGKSNTKGRARAFGVFFIILAVLAVGGVLYWLHARHLKKPTTPKLKRI